MTDDRPGSPHSRFVERVRARPLSSWDAQRVRAAELALRELAGLAWRAEFGPSPAPLVPALGPHAVADQLEVLLADASRAGAPREAVRRVVAQLADALSLRLD